MRTTTRDQTGLTVFSGSVPGAGGGSGTGVAGPVPFTWSRPSTGQFQIKFDTALTPLTVLVAGDNGLSVIYGLAAGTFSVNTFNNAAALVNANFFFTITARDTRR